MKVVAILSGGIDSSTLVFKLASEGEVHAITFDYGQRHSKEIECSKVIANFLGIHQQIVDISSIRDLLASSALTNNEIVVPEVPETQEHYETLKATIVPNRNAIMLSIAVGHAISIGANSVYYGAHFSDRGVYPDCRREFVESLQSALRLGTGEDSLQIMAPFVEITKGDIIKLGVQLGVPYALTWSCYKGGHKHCGVCSSCRERKRAFSEARVVDPTEYE